MNEHGNIKYNTNIINTLYPNLPNELKMSIVNSVNYNDDNFKKMTDSNFNLKLFNNCFHKENSNYSLKLNFEKQEELYNILLTNITKIFDRYNCSSKITRESRLSSCIFALKSIGEGLEP